MTGKPLYGTWQSPYTPRWMAEGELKLIDVMWDSDGETLVWLEGRGKQNMLVMQRGSDAPRDLLDDLSAKARVGYGGGDFTVGNGHVYFAAKGRLYRQPLEPGSAKPITPAFGEAAAPRLSPDGKWLIYVHTDEWVDGLALVDAAGTMFPRKLAYDGDFVMQPAWHPSGTMLAYVRWNFPHMPWNEAELVLATLTYDQAGVPFVSASRVIAGGRNVAALQPEFSPDGHYLSYLSDESGFWTLNLYDLEAGLTQALTRSIEGREYGVPAWTQGIRLYGWRADSRVIYALVHWHGMYYIEQINADGRPSEWVEDFGEYTCFAQIAVSPAGTAFAVIASNSILPPRLLTWEQTPADDVPPVLSLADLPGRMVVLNSEREVTIRKRSGTENFASLLPAAEPITWTGHDGGTVHGMLYLPKNPGIELVGLPPLIIDVHGGPTSQRVAEYPSSVHFFTTRGYAVLQVNHRGSTGYGKAYMEMHRGNWGVYDVEDSASGAQHLVKLGQVDAGKLVIMGRSAGGYTVLQSLVDKPGFYRAGICSFGISNQFALMIDPEWKFESQYSYWLLGDLPDAAAVWRDRSPLFAADKIRDALAIFQGDADVVVPKDQSDMLVAALKRRGVPHEYHIYSGEGHGWRKPETIQAYYKAVHDFLLRQVVYT